MEATNVKNESELIKGWQRYEKLRVLTPKEFTELYQKNISGKNFDEMVDELPERKKVTPALACRVELPETQEFQSIPDDIYKPVYNYIPHFVSSKDSTAMGYVVWRAAYIGLFGEKTGIILHPDWEEALSMDSEYKV